MKVYRPRYLWFDGAFREKHQLCVNDQGVIADIGPCQEPVSGEVVRADDEALMPGLCNVHSHAFQIALRGRTQHRAEDQEDTFWTWRQAMYGLADKIDPDGMYVISALAFLEMLRAGITSVGEFHYVHHQKNGKSYADPNELTRQVLRAARDVGIRISLLEVFYERGGYKKPLDAAQHRFSDDNCDAFLKRVDGIPKLLQSGESWGIAPHSVRAVAERSLRFLNDAATRFDIPLHMHVQEQPKEIRECKEEYGGRTPTEVLSDLGLVNERFTAVHAVHLTQQDFFLMKKHKGTVCACPTTERDLGDGVLDAKGFMDRKIPLCLGTDSQVLINLFEDARALEYQMRLKTLQRNVLGEEIAPLLMKIATENGTRALRLNAGALEKGRYADFIGVSLKDSSLAGANGKTLLTSIFFSMSPAALSRVVVGGKTLVSGGRHALEETIVDRAAKILPQL